MKIALIPIDNRPVCYNLPKEISKIDNDFELLMPDKKLLGGLTSKADIDGILNWLEKIDNVDAMVISLDTIAYGGLIASRRCKGSVDEIKTNLDRFKDKFGEKANKIYAFSSIMRISNNNFNEEEKEYWAQYGQQIFEYSYRFHKEGTDVSDVPAAILSEYLATRQRNFSINKMYLDWLEQGTFDSLVFSKDDCAEFGFNVLESEILKRKIDENNLPAIIKTGADEIPLTLLACAVCELKSENKVAPKISAKFLAPDSIFHITHESKGINNAPVVYPSKDLISNYEDISIEKCVQAQIELAGGKLGEEQDSDILLLVNNFEEKQGEIVMGIKTKPFSTKLILPSKPFMVADVRFANGADNKFIEKLFKKKLNFNNFYGYSGWNTSANTLGSLLCAAIVRYFAQDYNEEAFKKLQMIRFLDDWAYQANIRQDMKKSSKRPNVIKLKIFMLQYEKKLKKILGIKPRIKYYFPWKRFFEIGIIIK